MSTTMSLHFDTQGHTRTHKHTQEQTHTYTQSNTSTHDGNKSQARLLGKLVGICAQWLMCT